MRISVSWKMSKYCIAKLDLSQQEILPCFTILLNVEIQQKINNQNGHFLLFNIALQGCRTTMVVIYRPSKDNLFSLQYPT